MLKKSPPQRFTTVPYGWHSIDSTTMDRLGRRPDSPLRSSRGLFYDLYVVIDIFSRYVPGWLVAAHEDAELAKEFLEDAVLTQGVEPDQLTIHADRGGSMRSKPVSQSMMDLGITRSHSRPHVSNDNPLSEAALKTMKYCPTFPQPFGSLKTPARSATCSSITPTTCISTRALGYTPQPQCTTAPILRFTSSAELC